MTCQLHRGEPHAPGRAGDHDAVARTDLASRKHPHSGAVCSWECCQRSVAERARGQIMHLMSVRNEVLRERAVTLGANESHRRRIRTLPVVDCWIDQDTPPFQVCVDVRSHRVDDTRRIGTLNPREAQRLAAPPRDRIRIIRCAVRPLAGPDVRVVHRRRRHRDAYLSEPRLGHRDVAPDNKPLRTTMAGQDRCQHG